MSTPPIVYQSNFWSTNILFLSQLLISVIAIIFLGVMLILNETQSNNQVYLLALSNIVMCWTPAPYPQKATNETKQTLSGDPVMSPGMASPPISLSLPAPMNTPATRI